MRPSRPALVALASLACAGASVVASVAGARDAHAEPAPDRATPSAAGAADFAPREADRAATAAGRCLRDEQCPARQFCGDDGACTTSSYLPVYLRWNDRSDHSTTTFVGPVFRVADRRGSTSSLFPIFWRFHDERARATTSFLFPLLATHSAPTERGAIVGPIYGYGDTRGWYGGLAPLLFLGDRDGRSHQVLFPAFFHARDTHAGTETFAALTSYWHRAPDGYDAGALPLAVFGRHGGSRYASVLGLYTYAGNARASTHVLGPLYAGKREGGFVFGIAPLLHVSHDGAKRLDWFLPPLFFHASDETERRSLTLVGPIFSRHDRDDVTSGLFPLGWHVVRGARTFDSLLPLVGRYRDEAQGRRAFWVGPFVHLRDDRRDRTTDILAPLFVRHDEPDYHVTVQLPFFWRVVDHDASGTALFPLYLRVRQRDLASDVLFPLVWRFRSRAATTTVVGPAFYRHGEARSDGGLLPVFGFGGTSTSRYAWVLPLALWHSSDDTARTSRTIFSLFLWDRTRDGWTSALFPAWIAWRRGPTARYFAPLAYHSSDDAAHSAFTLLGPLYFGHEAHARRAGVLPLLFTSSHDDGRWRATLFPLLDVARKGDGGTRVLTPIAGLSTYPGGGKGFLGPLYVRRDRDGYTAALLPLFYRDVDTRAGTWTTALPPLWLHRATPDTSLTAVTPLFWRYRSIESSTTLAFPLFFDQRYHFESRTVGVLPLFIHHRTFADGSTSTILPPLLLYVHRGTEGHDVVLFPLLWRFVGRTADDQPARTTVLFPLFWDVRRAESRTQVLFPLYVRAHRELADHTLVLNVYYRKGLKSAEGSYAFNFFPLFDFGRPSKGDVEWSLLEGFVGYQRIGRQRTLKLFWATEVALDPVKGPVTTSFDSTPTAQRWSMQ